MRFLLRFQLPTETVRAKTRDGTVTEVFQSILEEVKPEAGYFTSIDGERG